MELKNILMTYKFPHDKEVQNTVNYYFCDVCHYCFEAESLPERCPDCGKTDYQNRPTRELCLQIADDLNSFAKYIDGLHIVPSFTDCGMV